MFGPLAAARAELDDSWCAVAAEALSWLPPDLQSQDLTAAASRAPPGQRGSSSAAQDWSVDLEDLRLRSPYCLPEGITVVFVETLEGLGALEASVTMAPAVGVDTEFGRDAGSLALVQIACQKVCYLVDARPCTGIAFQDRLRSVLAVVFDRPVFGWSFQEDSRRLLLLHDGLRHLLRRVKDLQPLARRRLGLPQTPSLQRAVAGLLGVFLDKGEQRSDWDRRPLSKAQTHYAACDAVVLFRLAHALGEDHGVADPMLEAEGFDNAEGGED